MDAASLERIVPDQLRSGEATGSETLRLHLERYNFACENLIPGIALDIACGVGYGTVLLGQNRVTTKAVGVDISPSAVEYASNRYPMNTVSFVCSSATEFKSAVPFDNVVSLETIEHVDDPWEVFSHFVSLLKPGGRLIASVPVTPSVDANPHHKTNFSPRTFRKMGAEHSLQYVNSMQQVQRFDPFAIATRKEQRSSRLRQNLPLFYLHNPSHLVLRLWSTLRDGFANKYMTVVWQRQE